MWLRSFFRPGAPPMSDSYKYHVLLVTYEQPDEACAVIDRVQQLSELPHALTVVDNNSSADARSKIRRKLAEFQGTTYIQLNENRFCGGGSNLGMRLVNEEFVVYVCARECYPLAKGWDRLCIDYMRTHPRVGIAGHLIRSNHYLDGHGYRSLEKFPKFRRQDYVRSRLNENFYHIQGGFYVLRAEAIDLEEAFNPAVPHNHMDVELSYFLEAEGWELGDMPFVRSLHSTTRPPLEGFDPSVSMYHPLSLEQLQEYERARDSELVTECSICGQTNSFSDDAIQRCRGCGSSSALRRLWLLASDTRLGERRALISDAGLDRGFVRPGMATFDRLEDIDPWTDQFDCILMEVGTGNINWSFVGNYLSKIRMLFVTSANSATGAAIYEGPSWAQDVRNLGLTVLATEPRMERLLRDRIRLGTARHRGYAYTLQV